MTNGPSNAGVGALLVCLLWAALEGCAGKLPSYAWIDGPTALATMRDRAAALTTLSCEADVLLQHDDTAAHLDAAIVARPPEYLRVRMWKLMRPVGDVTVTPQGMWVVPEPGPEPSGATPVAGGLAAGLHRTFAAILGAPDPAHAQFIDDGGRRFVVVTDDGPVRLRLEIDRATLTVRRCTALDESGAAAATLELQEYALIDGAVVFPRRLTGVTGSDRFVIHATSVRVNEAIAAAAFEPPSRAVRVEP